MNDFTIVIVLHCRPHSCWSYLGMIGGSQAVSLQSPGCLWAGVAAHELMHALGFVHEQSRSDRDHHVSILWENIIDGKCLNPALILTQSIQYDSNAWFIS